MNGFRREAEDYISMRRALGFKFVLQGRLVIEFVGYLEDIGATRLTTAAALAWATKPAGADPAWWNQRLSAARGFARHLHNLDPATEVPPPTLLSGRFRRATPFCTRRPTSTPSWRQRWCCATRFDGPPTAP